MKQLLRHWLVKQEPTGYSWSAFVADGHAAWTGVRNYQARNNLRAMKKGDLVMYYHSVVGKEIVGVAKVAKEAYPDPTAEEGEWSCVDLVPVRALACPVTLENIRENAELQDIALVKNSRISVIPLTPAEFHVIERMGKSRRNNDTQASG